MTIPPLRHPDPRRILVIKLGALGDFIQAFSFMRAIRRRHPRAHITLMTTPPFAALAQSCPYADDVLIDTRPSFTALGAWRDLRVRLNAGHFDRVYDLQNNDRAAIYRRLFRQAHRPDWFGTPRGARHAFDRHTETLARAGIHDVAIDDLSWMKGSGATFVPDGAPYILLVPGAAPRRPEKRWPADHYAQLAAIIAERGTRPVVIGGADDSAAAQTIAAAAPQTIDLTGKTAIADLPALARGAIAAIGNDTGPMHLIAATGCPALVLFSRHSDPALHAPRGPRVQTLRADELSALPVSAAAAALATLPHQSEEKPASFSATSSGE